MARAQSSLAMSAALCSSARMLRPESSATTLASACPFGLGANGITVVGLSPCTLITTSLPYRAADWYMIVGRTTVAQQSRADRQKDLTQEPKAGQLWRRGHAVAGRTRIRRGAR